MESLSFEENKEALVNSLDKFNIDYKCLDDDEVQDLERGILYASFPSESFGHFSKGYLKAFEPEDCVVVRGSIQFCQMLQREAKWVPCVYCNWKAFECTNYFPKLKNHLLNGEEYMMLPYGDLLRQKEKIYHTFGVDDTVFIRPNRGNKIFTGEALKKEKFEKMVECLGFYDVQSSELCVITYPVNVVAEYRFIVVDGIIIAGSKYRPTREEVVGGSFWDYAQEVVSETQYNPNRVWSIDVCVTAGGRVKILEIGSFSSAGIYRCNTDAIVENVSRVALDEWSDLNIYV